MLTAITESVWNKVDGPKPPIGKLVLVAAPYRSDCCGHLPCDCGNVNELVHVDLASWSGTRWVRQDGGKCTGLTRWSEFVWPSNMADD